MGEEYGDLSASDRKTHGQDTKRLQKKLNYDSEEETPQACMYVCTRRPRTTDLEEI